MNTNDITEQLFELEVLLKKHDKYYDYSDDHSVWSKGNAEWKSIQSLSTQLKLAGYTEEVQELFEKFYNCI